MADILIHAGDPGAANFIAPLLEALGARGHGHILLASPAAADQFRRLGEEGPIGTDEGTAAAILEHHATTLLLTGTSETIETFAFELVAEARQRGVFSVGVVDGRANVLARFRGSSHDRFAHAPDMIMVPDQTVADEMLAAGLPSARIAVTGHPLWDLLAHRAAKLRRHSRDSLRRRLFPNCPADRPIVIFLSELSGGLDNAAFQRGPHFSLIGTGNSQGRTEIALEEFLLATSALTPRPYLVLRLHPKSVRKDFAGYVTEIDQISEKEAAADVVLAADLVVGVTTSLLDEAAILGCPTLAILPDPAQVSWLPSIDWGLTLAVSRRADIGPKLHEMLAGGRRPGGLDPRVPVGAIETATRQLCQLFEEHSTTGAPG